jgi:hypothetical protein
MAGQGLVPARGNWESRWFETTSTATFAKGSLVNFADTYRLKEYASTDSQAVGIAASHSTASTLIRGLPMVQVYLPTPNCTAYSDVTTGVTQSSMSIGRRTLIYKQGNNMSYASTVGSASAAESAFSSIAEVVGPIDADLSRVEIAFNIMNVAFYSTSTVTFLS